LYRAVQAVSRPIENGGYVEGKVIAADVRLDCKSTFTIQTPLREDAKEAKTWESLDEEEETLLRENTLLKVECNEGRHRVDEEQLLDVGVRHKVLLARQQVEILDGSLPPTWSS